MASEKLEELKKKFARVTSMEMGAVAKEAIDELEVMENVHNGFRLRFEELENQNVRLLDRAEVAERDVDALEVVVGELEAELSEAKARIAELEEEDGTDLSETPEPLEPADPPEEPVLEPAPTDSTTEDTPAVEYKSKKKFNSAESPYIS